MRKKLIISQWSYSPKIQLMKKASGTFHPRSQPPKQINFPITPLLWPGEEKCLWGTEGQHLPNNNTMQTTGLRLFSMYQTLKSEKPQPAARDHTFIPVANPAVVWGYLLTSRSIWIILSLSRTNSVLLSTGHFDPFPLRNAGICNPLSTLTKKGAVTPGRSPLQLSRKYCMLWLKETST